MAQDMDDTKYWTGHTDECLNDPTPECICGPSIYVGIQWTIPGEMTLAELADRLDAVGLDWALSSLGRLQIQSVLAPKEAPAEPKVSDHKLVVHLGKNEYLTIKCEACSFQRGGHRTLSGDSLRQIQNEHRFDVQSPEEEPEPELKPKPRFFVRHQGNGSFVYDIQVRGGDQCIAAFWNECPGDSPAMAEKLADSLNESLVLHYRVTVQPGQSFVSHGHGVECVNSGAEPLLFEVFKERA